MKDSIVFATYDGDCCYFEPIQKQRMHENRIGDWLKSGAQVSVVAFNFKDRSGLDMLVAVGTCSHMDLFDSVTSRDMNFRLEGEELSVDSVIGGFCAKKNGIGVVHTRDSDDLGGIKSAVGNIHRQSILLRLDKLCKIASLDQNRKARMATAPDCKDPILSFPEQLKKLRKWKRAYDKWDYKSKGGFPEIPADILKQAEAAAKPDGFRPAVEINFYLSTLQEHMRFVMQVLWKLELKRNCDVYGGGPLMATASLKPGAKWPGKSVRIVGLDIEAYREEEGVSGYDVWVKENDPIHVESLTHLMMHGRNEYKRYGTIPGINMVEGRYTRLGYRVISDADGIAIDGSEERLEGFIASRLF